MSQSPAPDRATSQGPGCLARTPTEDAGCHCPAYRGPPLRRLHLNPLRLMNHKPPDTAERRQLTVMFVDLVGSTAMSTKLDPGLSPSTWVMAYWPYFAGVIHP